MLKILPKKGDLSLPGNYRGIMLLEVSYKIIAIIIQRRLVKVHQALGNLQQCHAVWVSTVRGLHRCQLRHPAVPEKAAGGSTASRRG